MVTEDGWLNGEIDSGIRSSTKSGEANQTTNHKSKLVGNARNWQTATSKILEASNIYPDTV